ncbi:hypothetical protein GTY44_06785, partial [Streptomyces sp. SID5914]|nr:hypothetical protein [Streptomyces sp. SID5914]
RPRPSAAARTDGRARRRGALPRGTSARGTVAVLAVLAVSAAFAAPAVPVPVTRADPVVGVARVVFSVLALFPAVTHVTGSSKL